MLLLTDYTCFEVHLCLNNDLCCYLMLLFSKVTMGDCIAITYEDNTHDNNDHADHSGEWNQVIGEWKSKLRFEDYIGPVE